MQINKYIYAYIVIHKDMHTHTDKYISILHYQSTLLQPEDIKKNLKDCKNLLSYDVLIYKNFAIREKMAKYWTAKQ